MIFLKKKHVIPKQGGGGGVPHLGKIPTFSRFFWGGASLRKIDEKVLLLLLHKQENRQKLFSR